MTRLIWVPLLVTLTACQTASGSFCAIAPDLRYRQAVYDAMDEADAAKHLAYLQTRERLCK